MKYYDIVPTDKDHINRLVWNGNLIDKFHKEDLFANLLRELKKHLIQTEEPSITLDIMELKNNKVQLTFISKDLIFASNCLLGEQSVNLLRIIHSMDNCIIQFDNTLHYTKTCNYQNTFKYVLLDCIIDKDLLNIPDGLKGDYYISQIIAENIIDTDWHIDLLYANSHKSKKSLEAQKTISSDQYLKHLQISPMLDDIVYEIKMSEDKSIIIKYDKSSKFDMEYTFINNRSWPGNNPLSSYIRTLLPKTCGDLCIISDIDNIKEVNDILCINTKFKRILREGILKNVQSK